MDWVIWPAAVAVVVIYWRSSNGATRRRFLIVGTIGLSVYLTWQFMPGLDDRPIDRLLFTAIFFAASLALIGLTTWAVQRAQRGQRGASRLALVVILGIFALFKWPNAWTAIQQPFLTARQQPAEAAIPAIAWLGLSYLLFRLLHVLLEARRRQLGVMPFSELMTYALFPPSLIAGPIDRFPRFKGDLDRAGEAFHIDRFAEGLWRILAGAVKKFVIADFLARLPLDLAQYPKSTPWPILWLVLYGYGFWLYFDFAGYTDMAIGVARLIGFQLPENFDAPYLKTNLARFWQAWHMTLSFWARDYVFFPLARTLRSKAPRLPSNLAALLSHLATMLTIGLWHGLTWPFMAWGVWHGLGLFAVKVWGDWMRPRHIHGARGTKMLGMFVTFNFVMLGWVWFGARDLPTAITTLGRLFGIR